SLSRRNLDAAGGGKCCGVWEKTGGKTRGGGFFGLDAGRRGWAAAVAGKPESETFWSFSDVATSQGQEKFLKEPLIYYILLL
ncbi:MAG: hypothetical protein KC964_24745, partial [Candidatus Omnitrophica bacterium]|nr:hypothetical protein [Candidatus Omnitrophota bacterium]